jgi:O-antigen/teichoic acid export membrane protein
VTEGAPPPAAGEEPLDPLTGGELRRRATSGAALLGARSALIYALGIVANLVLARLLAPRDFGLVALGTTVVVLGTYLADGGFGAALIRRDARPERIELQAVLGLQLGLTTGLAVAVAAVAAPFGRDGLVVATMVASLPIAILRAPSVIVLERQLQYRVIATADVTEALVYYLWAISAVALGFGVYGLATAVVVRSLAGTAVVIAIGPLGLVRPRWSWPHVRPLIRFGAKVQFTSILLIAREQGLNVVVAAVAGLATLGVWNLAWRVLQVPNLLFLTVGRVAFPALSRLLGAGESVRSAIERGVGTLAALTGMLAVGLAGAGTALPAIVGESWADVPAVLFWSGIALIVAAPIGTATASYLYAAGHAGTVAAATLVTGTLWFGLAAALLPRYGAPAVAIGWVASGFVNSVWLARRTAARSGAHVARCVLGPSAVGLGAVVAAWLVARRPDEPLVGGALGLVAGELLLFAGMWFVARGSLRDSRVLLVEGLASFRRADRSTPPAA